ncbi:4a-hydroxytetrahydrobiopterin dehydratase [Gordonia neofelifaecis]|uniref:Putative pterin-4-alpha-carbinolamine dehydratase n=1 Tax=Gordonia neofelifaecis NRRL B-59395 TaxID=644548 RepID=F1YHW5_9ACTN|nr:4a-hydroxytetrahydrobiopterin dehydratase [Gordonia neofelifaecis]EGD55519.1 Pterin-4a-carbinolamine dehydratase-like protein [Gordonia neofelifaecis NRRL B-59395]
MSDQQPEPVTDADADAQTPAAWSVADGMLTATYRAGNMVRGLELVTAVVGAAEQVNHHPDIDLRYPTVTFRLVTHSAGQLATFDIGLARQISRIAEEMGIEGDRPA